MLKLLGINWVKIGIYGAVLMGVLLIIELGYIHYTSLQNKLITLEHERAQLDLALVRQTQTIDAQTSAINEWRRSQEELQTTILNMQRIQIDAQAEIRRLRNVFTTHDIESLAEARPNLIEERLNSGTARIKCLLEGATTAGGNQDC